MEITQLNGPDLEEFIQNHTYAIVGFFSKSSSFCAAGQGHLQEVVDSIAAHSDTNVISFAKVWVEDLEDSFLDYGPTSLPSLVFYYLAKRERILGSLYIDDDVSETYASILSWLLDTIARDP
ncbi:MAG: hypothetical protein RTU92_00215 [Candidatus Thorarchaeota archaeon]